MVSSCSLFLTKQSSAIQIPALARSIRGFTRSSTVRRTAIRYPCIVSSFRCTTIVALLHFVAGLVRIIVPFQHQAVHSYPPASTGLPPPHNVVALVCTSVRCGIHEPTPVISTLPVSSSGVLLLVVPPTSSVVHCWSSFLRTDRIVFEYPEHLAPTSCLLVPPTGSVAHCRSSCRSINWLSCHR
jgi:hypothetical protein